MKQRWKPVLAAAGASVAVALLGMLSTDLGDWYLRLHKPSWQPPDIVFGPVWTLIYALTAAAGVRGWRLAPTRFAREWLLALFACNVLLNVLWSLLFFRLRHPDWALLEVGVFWASTLALALVVGRWDRRAALLLVPYGLWVAFASILNLAIVDLNAPFAAVRPVVLQSGNF
jgi:translocator protein